MGKTDFGFMAGFSGRLGNLIGYRWRGRMCVRTMPSHYRDARTPEQLQQRALFKAVVQFAAKARQVLKKSMNAVSLDAQMTESNYFMRVNKRCFALAAGTQDELQVDYENLLLADGPVAPVAFYEPQMQDETTLSVDFEKNPLHRAVKWEDLVYLVAYCPELGDFDISAPVYRRSNRLTMSLNPYWVGREVHLWGFVVDGNGRASQSQYLGGGILDASQWETADMQPDEQLDLQVDMPTAELPSTVRGRQSGLDGSVAGSDVVCKRGLVCFSDDYSAESSPVGFS